MKKLLSLALLAALMISLSPRLVLALSEEQRRIFDSNIQYFDVDGGIPASCTTGGTALSGSDNAEKIWNFFIGKGLSAEQAAGVMGNLQAESGFDPFNQQNGSTWPSGGWGIAQWTNPGRRDSIRDAVISSLGAEFYVPTEEAGHMIGTPQEERLLSFQLDYLYNESTGRTVRPTPHPFINQPPPGTNEWEGLKTMTTVEDATYYWEWNYERPASPHAQSRIQFAQDIFARYGSSGGTGSSSGGVTCGGNGTIVGGFSLPLDKRWFDENPNWLTKPHHDYPASDLPVPEGTPVYSMTAGTVISAPTGADCGVGVTIDAGNGITFSYCHGIDGGSVDGARQGDTVSAGQLIMHSGNTGNSFGAHLHLGIKVNGESRCPQPLLEGIYYGSPPEVTTLPASGCSYNSGGRFQ